MAGGYDRQAITARGEWHRPLASHSGAAATGSVSGGAKEWRAITVVAATREPTQTLPMHFIKLVIRTIQLSTSLLCLDRMASLNRMIIIIDSILTIPQLGHSQRKSNDDSIYQNTSSQWYKS